MNRLVASIPERLFRQRSFLQKCFSCKSSFAINQPLKKIDLRHFSNTSIPAATSVKEDDAKSTQEDALKNESITERLRRLSTQAVEEDSKQANNFDTNENSEFEYRSQSIEEVSNEDLKQLENIDSETPSEPITDRLRRLSTSAVEDFEPSPGVKLARLKAKARYSNLEMEYQRRYPQRTDHGFRNSYNFNSRNNNKGRYFSTNCHNRLYNSDTVIDRLRRLSVSSGSVSSDYTPGENVHDVKKPQFSVGKSKNYLQQNKYRSSSETWQNKLDKPFRNEGGKQTAYTSNSNFQHKENKFNRPSKQMKSQVISDDYFTKHFEDDEIDDHQTKRSSNDFTIATQNDPDTFGTLSSKETVLELSGIVLNDDSTIYSQEEDDDIKFKPFDNWTQRKLRFKIKELVNANKLGEAIDTLTTAHKEGGFPMDRSDMRYLYSIVIAACAKVGYVQMSFKLFLDMKNRGLIPKQGIYTSLFNACANSPWDAEENINRIQRLRQNMLDKSIEPNLLNCHAMIKAYGRCGDIQAAFAVVDEIKNKKELTTETFNFLLQACVSDKQNGFRHVIVTWRKMKKLRLRPDIYTYNLLLRAVRECSIQHLGPVSSPKLENHVSPKNKEELPQLPAVLDNLGAEKMMDRICYSTKNHKVKTDLIVNSLEDEEIVKTLALSENRLAMFGGLKGIISFMSRDQVEPDIKTMMELLQTVHPAEFGDVLKLLEKFAIKPDISFFNLMIKKYQYNKYDYQCLTILQQIGQYHLSPNIMTWGVLSLGCKSWVEARSLLNEMEEANFLPNLIIMETFLAQAVYSFDPLYVVRVMEELRHREMKPNDSFLMKLQNFRDTVQKGIVFKEMGKPVNPPQLVSMLELNPNFEQEFVMFKQRYEPWLKVTEVFIEPRDPWESDFRKRYPPKSKPKDDEVQATDSELLRKFANDV